VTIQNQYSLLNRTFEIGLSEFCAHEGIGLLPYSVLSMGVLAGKYLGGQKPEGARFTISERNSSRYNAPEAQEAIRAYVDLAKKHGMDPSSMAIAFANMQPFTTSTIIGATTLEQLKTDIDACNVVLSPELLKDIDALYKKIPDPAV
jgi:aryl-alcohol dehydrogenase-like predicted oxidoreductase